MVEVLVGGQFGYAATPHLTRGAILLAVARAREQAEKASRFSLFKFDPSARPRVNTRFASRAQLPLHSKSSGEILDRLIDITKKLRISPKIVRTEAFALATTTEIRFLSTNGSEAEQSFDLITSDFSATAQDGATVQTRSDAGMRGKSYQGGWEQLFRPLSSPSVDERTERVARQAIELLSAPDCPNGKFDLVLMPDQMMLQIHESIGHPLELDRILGDERNYAGWSFVQLEDFGRLRYGSELMNVTFDPTVEGEYASYAFDDVGALAKREHLIQKGILRRALGGIESQLRTGLPGVANARASSWNRPPIDRMANINLEPGASSFDEIISAVEDGVLMESNRSWSIDDFRNKFQFGCEYGRRIRNGTLAEVVKNPNYRGVTVPFWTQLKKVGNETTLGTYGTPYCGKGEPSQAIRVGHRSPVCLFSDVELFGGGA